MFHVLKQNKTFFVPSTSITVVSLQGRCTRPPLCSLHLYPEFLPHPSSQHPRVRLRSPHLSVASSDSYFILNWCLSFLSDSLHRAWLPLVPSVCSRLPGLPFPQHRGGPHCVCKPQFPHPLICYCAHGLLPMLWWTQACVDPFQLKFSCSWGRCPGVELQSQAEAVF